MKPRHFVFLPAFTLSITVAPAADRFWDNSLANGDWQQADNWSADSAGTIPGAVPVGGDDVFFNISSLNSPQVVSLNGNSAVGSLNFSSTGTVTLQGGGANRVLTLAGGINVLAGSGAVGIGGGTNQNVAIAISAAQSWLNNSSNTLLVSNGINSSAAGAQTLTIGGSGATTLSGALANGSGIVGLSKTGAGTLTLSNTNSYTGVTTLSGGTTVVALLANGGSNSGIGAATADSANLIFDGGTLDWAGTGSTGFNRGFTVNAGGGTIRNNTALGLRADGKVTGAGNFNKTGTGTLAFANTTNDYSGITRIVEGTLAARVAAALGASGSAANGTIIEAGATLFLDPSGGAGAGTAISVAEHLTLRGGAVTSSGFNNTLTGGVVLENNSILSATSNTLSVNGIISESGGARGFTKTGAGTVTLNGANTYTGVVTVSAGTLVIGSSAITNGGAAGALGMSSADPSNLILDGGTLAYNGSNGTNRGFTLAAGKTSGISSGSGNVFRADGLVTGSGNLNKTGAGLVAFTNAESNYTGIVNVNTGTLSLRKGAGTGGNSTLGTSTGSLDGTVINAGGTLQFDPASPTGGSGGNLSISEHITLNGGTLRSQSLSNTLAGAVILSANSNVSAASGATLRFSSAITESATGLGITKTDVGTVVIENTANTYTGTTAVSAGTLSVVGNINSSTALTVTGGTFAAGATDILKDTATITLGGGVMQLNGFSDTTGPLIVSGTAELALGGGNSSLVFGDSSGQTWTSAALSITGWSGLAIGGGAEQLTFSAAGLNGSQLAAITFVNPDGFSTGTYSAKFIGNELVPDALIPEPSATLLVAAGSLLLVRRRR